MNITTTGEKLHVTLDARDWKIAGKENCLAFIETLKGRIPKDAREYDSVTKTWIIDALWEAEVLAAGKLLVDERQGALFQ